MLFLAKNNDSVFYTNSGDAITHFEKGYDIIDENTGHILTEREVNELEDEKITVYINT